jgi:hypothetical protein
VRYVTLAASPPDRSAGDLPLPFLVLRDALLGAFACGSVSLQVTGRPVAGLTIGGAIGAASAVLARMRVRKGRGFALVPWGVLVDGEHELKAIRWSGVRALDVKYRASRDGSVHARVTVETADDRVGELVGFSSDAVDLGALAGDLDSVTEASARPLAIDLEGSRGPSDGEPFVERVLDAARTILASEGGQSLGLEPISYRHAAGPPSVGEGRVARVLGELGVRAERGSDPWGLVAALAGELRLRAFAPELSRLSNNPHPGVAAFARAALSRVVGQSAGCVGEERDADMERVELDEGEALSWFVPPDELARLRAWSVD